MEQKICNQNMLNEHTTHNNGKKVTLGQTTTSIYHLDALPFLHILENFLICCSWGKLFKKLLQSATFKVNASVFEASLTIKKLKYQWKMNMQTFHP